MSDHPTRREALVGGVAATAALTLLSGEAEARQVHMERAIEALQTAKRELQAAAHNKGGHRRKAIELVDRAIHETRAGIRFRDQHS